MVYLRNGAATANDEDSQSNEKEKNKKQNERREPGRVDSSCRPRGWRLNFGKGVDLRAEIVNVEVGLKMPGGAIGDCSVVCFLMIHLILASVDEFSIDGEVDAS